MLLQPYTATFQDQMGSRGSLARESWNELFSNYRRQYPDLADAMDRMHRGEMPGDWQSALPVFPADAKGIATRDSQRHFGFTPEHVVDAARKQVTHQGA